MSRRLAMAGVMLAMMTTGAPAADGVAGIWQGRYRCGQGVTALTLTIAAVSARESQALFHFYESKFNRGVPEGCYAMTGRFDPATRAVTLKAGAWLLRPDGYVTVDLAGTLSRDGATLAGNVAGPGCTTFELRRIDAALRDTPDACRGPNVS